MDEIEINKTIITICLDLILMDLRLKELEVKNEKN